MMPFRDIVACMAEIGISVYEEDLQRPSAQTTQMIFTQLLDKLMACPPDAIERPRTTLLGMMQHKVTRIGAVDNCSDHPSYTMSLLACKGTLL
jgi:hypothetical protein